MWSWLKETAALCWVCTEALPLILLEAMLKQGTCEVLILWMMGLAKQDLALGPMKKLKDFDYILKPT